MSLPESRRWSSRICKASSTQSAFPNLSERRSHRAGSAALRGRLGPLRSGRWDRQLFGWVWNGFRRGAPRLSGQDAAYLRILASSLFSQLQLRIDPRKRIVRCEQVRIAGRHVFEQRPGAGDIALALTNPAQLELAGYVARFDFQGLS